MGIVGTSRRDFVKLLTSSGIALSVSRLALAEQPDFAAREILPGRQAWNPAATGAGRIDGVAKVTGSKLYASDFRAADLPGWPAKTSHAMLIRATDATHIYDGIDLSRLSGALKPSVVVTAEDLERIGTRVPEFFAGDLFCPLRKTPLYLGQPIALLIFEDFDVFDQARFALRDATIVKYGEETGAITRPPYAAFRFTRVAGATPEAPDVYSPFKNGWVSPGKFKDTGHPIWERLPLPTGQEYAEAAGYGEDIRAENRYEQFQSGIKRHAVSRFERRKSWTSSSSILFGATAPPRRRADGRRGFSSAPASLASPRTTAPARIVPWRRWKSIRKDVLPSASMTRTLATPSGRRSPTGSQTIWAAWLTRLRSRKPMPLGHWRWCVPAIPTRSIRRRRTLRRAIRVGSRKLSQPPLPPPVPMSARMRRPRPRECSSALAFGRPRSNCGALRQTIRARRNGRRRAGVMRI